MKTSRKPDDHSSHSSDFITKTTSKDGSLLIGARELWQTEVRSYPDAKKKFGEEQVETRFSLHEKATVALREAVEAKKDETNQ